MTDMRMVDGSSCSTSASAMPISTRNQTMASQGAMRREAMGRSRVRLTKGSKSRSARSLMTQPAERMATVPSTKITSTFGVGCEAPAIHTAHNTGQSSSQMPMGRCRRATSMRSRMRRA